MFDRLSSRAALAPLAAILMAGLVGCSDDSSTSSDKEPVTVTPPAVVATPTLDTVRHLRFPSEAYAPTAAEQNLVIEATRKLTSDCMRQFGFTWTAQSSPLREVHQVDRAYGVADLDTAQKYGYRLPPTDGRATADNGGKRGAGKPYSPSELLVLTGSRTGQEGAPEAKAPGSYQGKQIPPGGCATQSRRQVAGMDDIDPTHAAEAIAVGMWEKSKSDPRVVKAIKAWSACMKESGYDYESPIKAGDPKWSSGSLSAAEIRAAVADVKCKQRTNLISVWFNVESAYEKQAIQQNIEQLTQIKKRWADAARKAAQILGRPAPQPS